MIQIVQAVVPAIKQHMFGPQPADVRRREHLPKVIVLDFC